MNQNNVAWNCAFFVSFLESDILKLLKFYTKCGPSDYEQDVFFSLWRTKASLQIDSKSRNQPLIVGLSFQDSKVSIEFTMKLMLSRQRKKAIQCNKHFFSNFYNRESFMALCWCKICFLVFVGRQQAKISKSIDKKDQIFNNFARTNPDFIAVCCRLFFIFHWGTEQQHKKKRKPQKWTAKRNEKTDDLFYWHIFRLNNEIKEY